ncbi:hypothetical protein GC174_07115 [bacterium]|nr:hypothetical protein [bacterium]
MKERTVNRKETLEQSRGKLLILLISVCLSACGGTTQTEIAHEQEPSPVSDPAPVSVSAAVAAKPVLKSEPAKDLRRAEFERGSILKKREKVLAQGKNPFLERYGRARLDKAATIKRYTPITILPVQLEAHCRTAWDRGNLHVRVAYLGPPHNLNVFMQENHVLHIGFTDQSGSPVYNFEIPIDQMQRAPETMNGGMPTYQVEGQLPVPLESYEQFYQWTCEWN